MGNLKKPKSFAEHTDQDFLDYASSHGFGAVTINTLDPSPEEKPSSATEVLIRKLTPAIASLRRFGCNGGCRCCGQDMLFKCAECQAIVASLECCCRCEDGVPK